MPERKRKWKNQATVTIVMIPVMMMTKSSVSLMNQSLMRIIRYISPCMIRLKQGDLV